jgi:hypothetical protein
MSSETEIPTIRKTKISPNVPIEVLETLAAEQRRQIHNSVAELRSRVHDKLDIETQAREHVWPAAGIAGLVSMILGYVVASMLRRPAPKHRRQA